MDEVKIMHYGREISMTPTKKDICPYCNELCWGDDQPEAMLVTDPDQLWHGLCLVLDHTRPTKEKTNE